MATKKSTPAPIDRPLSRAYLRGFTGWSTAYPPGLSDPTSLRVMHNCSIGADGSLKIRPGLRRVFSNAPAGDIVGEFEHFYTKVGKRALLFAVRLPVGPVVFRTAQYNGGTRLYQVDTTLDECFPGATDAVTQLDPLTKYVRYIQIDNKILALPDSGDTFRLFTVGATPTATKPQAIGRPWWSNADQPFIRMPDPAWINTPTKTQLPPGATPTASTLISNDASKNVYNFAYFYTFSSPIGETPGSMPCQVRVQRRWTVWDTNLSDDTQSADQLGIIVPRATWDAARDRGAVQWNLYFLTWSDQNPVPVEGVLIDSKPIPASGSAAQNDTNYQQNGWLAHTPLLQGQDIIMPIPRRVGRDDSTAPAAAANGLVAGDRIVLVYDHGNEARITWSSNQQGEYLNFSPSKGGGFKTLTSGNLYFPVAVKLWQNPQSADTITVLCEGLDGSGTAHYMAPNTTVTTQSQSTFVMGFEETSSTPGTIAPFGVEVLNNALYHPLDNNLMKSTASNYNINHLLIADAIQNVWSRVRTQEKRDMVSCSMDTSLYYLIKSPLGYDQTVPQWQRGNQVWVCDTAQSNAWSCWDVVGHSLKRLELNGRLYMSITSGQHIFVFDPEFDHDDIPPNGPGSWTERGIAWEAVTNTQGANRAHDAWANVQQVNVTFGNFIGECIYGIRGKDLHGQMVQVEKHFISPGKTRDQLNRFDNEDFLLVRRTMKEWEFYWKSVEKPKNRSHGAVSFVQYRYTPVTVNLGYEYGSVETFEYGSRAEQTVNAVPVPFADTGRP